MKKLLIALFALISLNSFAQRWETIKGNGQVKKETREVSNYTSLASQGSMDVRIDYGNSNSVMIEGDENLIPYIETKCRKRKAINQDQKECEPEIPVEDGSARFHD